MTGAEDVSDDSLQQFVVQIILLQQVGQVAPERACLNALLVWSVNERECGVAINLTVCGSTLKRLIRGKSRLVGAIRAGVANEIYVELGHGFGF
jgi:hypothetical protein